MNRADPLDLARLRVAPLADRESLTSADVIRVDPDAAPPPISSDLATTIDRCAGAIRAARGRDAAVILIYGAHLLRNGAAAILGRLLRGGVLTHVATNGAGSIHDWEYAWLGRSTEDVRANVAAGTFGAWDETGRAILLALTAGNLRGEGYGAALGRFITEDGATLPPAEALAAAIRQDPDDPLTAPRAEALAAIGRGLASRTGEFVHHLRSASILGQAFAAGVPATVHPGIGYDIISNHPLYSGATVGRAAAADFAGFGGSVDRLDGGVVLSVGSAIMGPQVFEKSLNCVHNLRFQAGRPPLVGHSFFVVDLQDGGGWDWSTGEPPKTNPAYYLRFCKSFARMGGTMAYLGMDNLAFVHHLFHRLGRP